VIELNRAAAIAMRDGPEAGLALIDAILVRGDLTDYHLAHGARGDLYRRLARTSEAISAYERALDLATRRLSEDSSPGDWRSSDYFTSMTRDATPTDVPHFDFDGVLSRGHQRQIEYHRPRDRTPDAPFSCQRY